MNGVAFCPLLHHIKYKKQGFRWLAFYGLSEPNYFPDSRVAVDQHVSRLLIYTGNPVRRDGRRETEENDSLGRFL